MELEYPDPHLQITHTQGQKRQINFIYFKITLNI